MTQTKRGSLICFEGCDRCGKTTQVSLLESFLKSIEIPVIVFKFPGMNYLLGEILIE